MLDIIAAFGFCLRSASHPFLLYNVFVFPCVVRSTGMSTG